MPFLFIGWPAYFVLSCPIFSCPTCSIIDILDYSVSSFCTALSPASEHYTQQSYGLSTLATKLSKTETVAGNGNKVAISGNFVAVSGDYSRRKRQQIVAVSDNYVAVFSNYVASVDRPLQCKDLLRL